jgi:integrase
MREFLAHSKAVETGLLLSEVTPDHLKEFFIWKRLKSASGTVAGFRRILRSIFIQAQEEGKISFNPVQSANRIKNRLEGRNGEATRKRPFTLDEIRAIHKRANPFWRFMIQTAFFTGMRLGDIVTLQRINANLSQGEIAFKSRKTGKSQRIPMHPDLKKVFAAFPKGNPEDYFWPDEAKRYEATGASSLSQEFYELLASAGIVEPRNAQKKGSGKGRDSKRSQTIIGFHNLRHTFVSMLKIGGAQDSIAKELAGHRSDLISTHYTHLPQDALADAINKLPEAQWVET